MKRTPTTTDVARWLSRMSREQLHDQGWIEATRRFHGIARAVRPFLLENFPDEQDQQAAFEGLTLALLIVGHFEDIEQLAESFDSTPAIADENAPPATAMRKNKADTSRSEPETT